ncbi:MAG: MBL fold metallo-hydrolase [Atopobiaceae bacterium]|nr:MBL fold metallo-hydrolase [Atopobiaceae bacterium]
MEKHLTVTVLTENSPTDGLLNEHGLSLLIQRDETRVLLDFGQSDAFAQNAEKLGLDLRLVDLAVLSHAHYDHADGMDAFFLANSHAPLHLGAACAENCWSTKGGTADAHYIGIKPGLLATFASRLVPVPADRTTTIAPGIHLVPHTTPGLATLGRQAGMFLLQGDAWLPDSFAHEVTLVIETADAPLAPLAIFSSCSHAGLPTTVDEVKVAFPNRSIAAYVGGLHLAHSTDDEVRAVAHAVKGGGIAHLYTGHCTGDRALKLLAAELPGNIRALHPGLAFNV